MKTKDVRDEVLGCYFKNRGDDPGLHRLDILHRDAVRHTMKDFQPEVVIHCAGESRVDFVEEYPDRGRVLNITGTENMAWDSAYLDARFVLISSNAVFGGDAPPYFSHSKQAPVNEYGRTKCEAEKVVMKYHRKGTIIRPIMLYGWPVSDRRDYLVTRILTALRQGQRYMAAADIFTQPTYAMDCARAIWQIAKKEGTGRWVENIGAPMRMSLYEFAIEVAKAFELDDTLVVPVKSESFKGLAKRPLDTTYAHNGGTPLPATPNDGLRRMRAEKP